MAMQTGTFRGFVISIERPGIVLITFDRPERLNSMTAAMKRDLMEVLLEAQLDDEVRVVVFTGNGRAFCAGDDIGPQTEPQGEGQALARPLPPGHGHPLGTYAALRAISQALNLTVRQLDKPTIAAINGWAIQSGLSLALACDFRIASRQARLGSGTLRFALMPDEGGHYFLVQVLGVAKAVDFILRNRIVSAEEALALGLVHEVVEPQELLPRAMALAQELCQGPQVAMRLLKRAIYNAAEMGMLQAFDDIAARTALSDHHPDAQEGVRAFREKRAPRFNRWLEEAGG
jgi:2-(1,2-epoxy-1,2-dihydrophenyl)acetyl-CoA isomerase